MANPNPKHRADAPLLVSSTNAPVRRSKVAAQTNYEDYKHHLRWDFWFHCAYCTISEAEAAGYRFTIDHYLPADRYPELLTEYGNLMYACDACNQFKGTAPSENAARRGLRFLRVDADDPDDHIELNATSTDRVAHKTSDIGEYTIERLYLNREPLRRLRSARARISKSTDLIRRGMRALLNHPVQDVPAGARARFLEIRDRMLARGASAVEMIDSTLVREVNRSELLDAPADCDGDARKRRAYLKSVNAPLTTVTNTK